MPTTNAERQGQHAKEQGEYIKDMQHAQELCEGELRSGQALLHLNNKKLQISLVPLQVTQGVKIQDFFIHRTFYRTGVLFLVLCSRLLRTKNVGGRHIQKIGNQLCRIQILYNSYSLENNK